jgi:hypothetical protein
MWIEDKGADGIVGPARIGRVTLSKSGRSLKYGGRRFESLKGRGFKANYFDPETGDYFWISGCRRDGRDALYSTEVQVDADVAEAHWREICGKPDRSHGRTFMAPGNY